MIACTNVRNSGTSVRSTSPSNASLRARPNVVSRIVKRSSSASGPSISSATFVSAASMLIPASTIVTTRSAASGSDL